MKNEQDHFLKEYSSKGGGALRHLFLCYAQANRGQSLRGGSSDTLDLKIGTEHRREKQSERIVTKAYTIRK